MLSVIERLGPHVGIRPHEEHQKSAHLLYGAIKTPWAFAALQESTSLPTTTGDRLEPGPIAAGFLSSDARR